MYCLHHAECDRLLTASSTPATKTPHGLRTLVDSTKVHAAQKVQTDPANMYQGAACMKSQQHIFRPPTQPAAKTWVNRRGAPGQTCRPTPAKTHPNMSQVCGSLCTETHAEGLSHSRQSHQALQQCLQTRATPRMQRQQCQK